MSKGIRKGSQQSGAKKALPLPWGTDHTNSQLYKGVLVQVLNKEINMFLQKGGQDQKNIQELGEKLWKEPDE